MTVEIDYSTATLPELALCLVQDEARNKTVLHRFDPAVHPAIQMIMHHIDHGRNLGERDDQGRTALDILVDPNSTMASDDATVFALIHAEAPVSPSSLGHLLDYMGCQLSAYPWTHNTLRLFHHRRHSGNPITGPATGNFYHMLAGAGPGTAVMILTFLEAEIDSATNEPLPQEEKDLFLSFLFEARELDGHTPVSLAWEAFEHYVVSNPQKEAEDFSRTMLPMMWRITDCYLKNGGDPISVNEQGRSVASIVRDIGSYASDIAWDSVFLPHEDASRVLSELSGALIAQSTPQSPTYSSRPRF